MYVNLCRDPNNLKRTSTHMSWFPDGPKKLAVAYCNIEFQGSSPDTCMDSYIWDVGKIHILNKTSFSSFNLIQCHNLQNMSQKIDNK